MEYIVGMDEVGTGAWAGPAFVASVKAKRDSEELLNLKTRGLLKDSKKLSRPNRFKAALELNKLIEQGVIESKLVEISVEDINKMGKHQALMLAFRQLIDQTDSKDKIIIDGNYGITSDNHQIENIIKADDKIIQVMAASIIAKEYRDALMRKYHEQYPHYGWEQNVGYGVPAHQKALREHGITPLHRLAFCYNIIGENRK